MPIVTIVAVVAIVANVFIYFGANNRGVEFFVESETEQAIIFVRARGNLSLNEKDLLVKQAEDVVLAAEGVESTFSFAGSGGLNQNTGGAAGPRDSIGQIQIEMTPWAERRDDPDLDGDRIVERLQVELDRIPGIKTEILSLSRGPASGKPVHLRLKSDNWNDLLGAVAIANAKFQQTPALADIEDTLPLPGIDWQIDVDVEKAGRFGADVATVGGMVQLVTRGILLDTMRVDTSDEEIEIRVRLPEKDRILSTLDTLKVRTRNGLVPLSNFVTRKPVKKLGQINRIDQKRYFDIKAALEAAGQSAITMSDADGTTLAIGLGRLVVGDAVADGGATVLREVVTPSAIGVFFGSKPKVRLFEISLPGADVDLTAAQDMLDNRASLTAVPVTADERIALITDWIETERPFAASVGFEWSGDAVEQAESQDFLAKAFLGALGLMFVILLAQFNSFYNAVLVLLAVVLSTTGVLIGMLVMQQSFSIIMTGTGIVALAGIVVNNNIVLIDTYQNYARYMPRLEAIVRTAEVRIRPVLLTTITTMAGLTPMMFGLSLDFIGGGYSIDSPTALWWKQLATTVVFGLGIATVLTLVLTPSMLSLRVWVTAGAYGAKARLAALALGRASQAGQDRILRRSARRIPAPEILWDTSDVPVDDVPDQTVDIETKPRPPLKAAE